MVYSLEKSEEFIEMKNKVISRTLIVMLLGLLLILLVSGCAIMKVKGTVAGYVYQYNRPMANWQVQLMDESGRMIATEPTNAQGHFTIMDVPPGDYTVYVLTFAGTPYPYEGHITVRPGRTEKFDIELGGEELPSPEGE